MEAERKQSVFQHLYRCFPSVDFSCLTMLVRLQLEHWISSKTIGSIGVR